MGIVLYISMWNSQAEALAFLDALISQNPLGASNCTYCLLDIHACDCVALVNMPDS